MLEIKPIRFVGLFLLSFSFDYFGGILSFFALNISIHSFQLLFAFIAFLLSVPFKKIVITREVKSVLLLLLLFVTYCYFNKGFGAPLYYRYKINLLLYSFLIIVFSFFSVQSYKELDFFLKLCLIQICISLIISGFDVNATNRIDNGEPITISRSAIILIFSSFFYNKLSKLFIISFLIIGLTSLITSASRGPFLSLLIVIIILNFKNYLLNIQYSIKNIFLFSLLISSPFFLSLVGFDIQLLNRLFSIFDLNDKIGLGDLERLNALKFSFDILSQNFITGSGFGNYPYEILGYDTRYYPHNIFAEILSETGIIGFILFSSILILLYKMIKKNKKFLKLKSYKFILGFYLIGLLSSQFSLEMPNQFLLFNSISISLIIFQLSNERKNHIYKRFKTKRSII